MITLFLLELHNKMERANIIEIDSDSEWMINQNIVDIPSDDEFMLPLTPPIGGLNWKPPMNFRQL